MKDLNSGRKAQAPTIKHYIVLALALQMHSLGDLQALQTFHV